MHMARRSPRRRRAGGPGRVLITLLQWLPFVIALIVLVIELTPAHFIYTGPLLTAMPALAAVTLGPRGTLVAAAAAVVVSVITATYNQSWATLQVLTNFSALTLVTVAGYLTSGAVQARRLSELEQVRRIAMAAQEVVLRPVPALLGPVRAASLSLAAGTQAQIGGDLYEAMPTRYGVRLIVGDVRGKGLTSMRAVGVVLGTFREAAHYEAELTEVMDHCSAALRREVAVEGAYSQEIRVEGFVTAAVAQVSDDLVVRVVNRGHVPPLLLHRGEVRTLLPESFSLPLSLEDLAGGPAGEADSYPFVPGDRLLLYTDGVSEARDRDNRFFPLEHTMEGIRADTSPQEFLEELHQALLRHTGGILADDVAMIAIDRVS